ncbi:terminase large subunit domain-containing protein [Calycomorphotria hydatis]|uniref:Phage Terminase n=1 Tax=Calycomorphotria hydatis TaxID=2528027 RepID=A0A517TDC4_9PLAN|nr:terminase family protein [Calycomorphotria hydatis]QDT66369.1 hypothetical protein V22_36350 [Calycomorphotria hydatis]
MTIIEAIEDGVLFGPFFGDLASWRGWLAILRVIYGLPLQPGDVAILEEVTGRKSRYFVGGFDIALMLVGRRSGKSRVAAAIAAYEAVLGGHETKLSPGETGYVAVISPTKSQSRIVKNYIRSVFDGPILSSEIVKETSEGFELRNGNVIEILAGDFRTVRGRTLVAAVVDEAAFFGVEEESKLKSDTELIRALSPGLATVGGKLIAISSPYARRGWTFQAYNSHFGNNSSSTLVVNCPSRTLNPTLPQSVVDEALANDRSSALAEYLGQFRDDVADYLPRPVIEAAVVKGRYELAPNPDMDYYAFADLSGGRSDDAGLAIAHRKGRSIVVDKLVRYKAPFNPTEVMRLMADELQRWDLSKVTGDNYSAEFVVAGFKQHGIRYRKATANRSELYLELLPRIVSPGELELLDNEMLIDQLASLERRTRSGGKDIIDHPKGRHDDLANAVAGAVFLASKVKRKAGPLITSH